METLDRILPVRVSLSAVAVALFMFVLWVEHAWGIEAQDLYKWLLGLIGTAILGDTWRPSGKVVSTPQLTPGTPIEAIVTDVKATAAPPPATG